MRLADWGMLVLCAVFWGSAYTFNKLTLAEMPTLTITAVRLLIAASVLYVFARWSGVAIPPLGPAWRPFFVFTLFSNILPFMLVLNGQRQTASGLAAVLGATTPLFLILLAHLYTQDERLVLRKFIGVLVGLAGVAVVVGTDAFAGWSSALGAKLSLVFAAFIYAVGAIYSKRLIGHPPLVIATMQMTCGMIVAMPFALAIDQPWTLTTPSPKALLALVATATLGSAMASVTYFNVFRRAGAVNAMLVTLLVPVTPILLGSLFLGEALLPREAIGAVIIATALIIIDGRLAVWLRRKVVGTP
jgi:drug/metabolite transporter (DMT)-like permease